MCFISAPHLWEQAYIIALIDIIHPDKDLDNMFTIPRLQPAAYVSADMSNSWITLKPQVMVQISIKTANGEWFICIMSSAFAPSE